MLRGLRPPGGRPRRQRHRRPGLRDALRPRQPGLASRPVRARPAGRGFRAGRRPPDPRGGGHRRGGLRAGHRAKGRLSAPLPRLRPRRRRGRADEGGLERHPPLVHRPVGDGDGVDRRGRGAPRPRRLRCHGAPARGQRSRVRRAGPPLRPPDRAARRLEGRLRRDHRGRGAHRAAGARPRVGAAARRAAAGVPRRRPPARGRRARDRRRGRQRGLLPRRAQGLTRGAPRRHPGDRPLHPVRLRRVGRGPAVDGRRVPPVRGVPLERPLAALARAALR